MTETLDQLLGVGIEKLWKRRKPKKTEMTKTSNEFDTFDRTMRDLMSVPHDEIKAALDAEKTEKQKKKRKAKKPSASAREGGGED